MLFSQSTQRSLIRCETIYHGLEALASLLRELTFLDTAVFDLGWRWVSQNHMTNEYFLQIEHLFPPPLPRSHAVHATALF